MAQKLLFVLLSVFLLVQYCQSLEGGHAERHGEGHGEDRAEGTADEDVKSSSEQPSDAAHVGHGKFIQSSGLRQVRSVQDQEARRGGGKHGK